MKKLLLIIAYALTLSFSLIEWKIPEEYKVMKNPEEATIQSIENGKELYMEKCKMCHGQNGIKSGKSDLTNKDFQNRTDGEIYYIITVGNSKMPGYEKKIPDVKDRWNIVNFIRKFK